MASRNETILLVEDDETLRFGLTDKLALEGYTVQSASTGEEGLKFTEEGPPDLAILDIGLPGMSGLEVLSRLRERPESFPVILLTARAGEGDKVLGLELGADDYITKPFGVRELIARVRAHLRRERRDRSSGDLNAVDDEGPKSLNKVTFGGLEIDFDGYVFYREGTEQSLSNLEWKIFELLIRERGKTVSRERFLREIWGYDRLPVTRTVDFHMSRLRQKIEANPKNPTYLKTVHGIGYRFDVP
ncbi:MAG: response regulator transcription factor [Planctomycetota bacterium]|nr:response regulator transcription factor [Planctomycetota bacterium]